MDRFIALDIETGGIGDDKSLLTACFIFAKRSDGGEMQIIDSLNLKIKPEDGIYHVTAESLEINHIDLKQHDKEAITEREAGQKLYERLKTWYTISGSTKLIPVGHNVAFDIRRVTNTLVSRGSWDSFVSYRVLDTCTIAQFLKMTNKLPNSLTCSLVNLGDYFKCHPLGGKPHEAEYDTLLALNVLEKLTTYV
jgi:DNA polymerase III epsilon subunit-like protein